MPFILTAMNFHLIHECSAPRMSEMTSTHTLTATAVYRADQVGSFLRPAGLLAARANPNITPDELRRIEDRSILDCLREQQQRGFRIFSDGEFRRATFMSD